MNNQFKPNDSAVWLELARQRDALRQTSLVELFKQDPARFDAMHVSVAGLTLDYSRNLISRETTDLLIKAAESTGLRDKIHSLVNGGKVNTTEDRPALHTALRDPSGQSPYREEIEAVMGKMQSLVEQIHTGKWKGCTGKPITDVVNIGIGGSHLGPMLATESLITYSLGRVRCHFVSNIDSTDLNNILARLVPDSTLFIVASKSFTTLETLQNAKTARKWLAGITKADADLSRHFIAVTAYPGKAQEFGIAADNVLPMWDWVGGRYSLWSAIGLPIALSIGMANFNRLRKGAADMDRHFVNSPYRQNLPVLLAMLGIWYINYWGASSQAVLPYLHHLRYFPEFLQQLEMESNGKSVRIDNKPVNYQTGGVIWGTVETNGQHSFHQLLHQGTQLVPVDFIFALKPERDNDPHHAYLVANCLAQSNALMVGKTLEEATQELVASGHRKEEAVILASHRQMSGNRPSNIIVMESLTPETLGALIALYEHKVFVQSVIWNINAFDQWGVELGKVVSNQIYARLIGQAGNSFDSSTEGLISLYKKVRG